MQHTAKGQTFLLICPKCLSMCALFVPETMLAQMRCPDDAPKVLGGDVVETLESFKKRHPKFQVAPIPDSIVSKDRAE